MKRRLAKKIAKRYLDSGTIMKKYILGIDEYRIIGSNTWKTELMVPWPIEKAIRKEAYRRGWDGCHWDNPLVISIEELA